MERDYTNAPAAAFQQWEAVCAPYGSLEPVREDDTIGIWRKGPGLAVETRRVGQQDVVSRLRNMGRTPYLVHRLDQPVQGLMAVAYTKQAAAGLSRQVQDGTMKKEYLAVCRPDGKAEPNRIPVRLAGQTLSVKSGEEFALEDWLLKDGRTNISRAVEAGTAGAKKARLTCRVLEATDQHVLVRVCLDTGRHHQIRVQLAHAGLPIVGDVKYGRAETGRGGSLLYLCACGLTLRHPVTGERIHVEL